MTDVVVIANSNSANDRLASALQGIAQVGNRCPDCGTLLSRRMDASGTLDFCPACGFSRKVENRLARIGDWDLAVDAIEAHKEVTL